MSKNIHLIYIPGLGDGYDPIRRFTLKFWRFYGVSIEHIPSSWSDGGEIDEKIGRINDAITRAKKDGKDVVLIGESAGGSLALNIYASNPKLIYRLVTLCGKNTRPENVSPVLYRRNPAFKVSMERVGASVSSLRLTDRQRITSIYPLYDPTVPVRETFTPDCRKVQIWSVGHIVSIFLGLTIYAGIIIREARRPL